MAKFGDAGIGERFKGFALSRDTTLDGLFSAAIQT
jgi:hypothetical protein